MNTVQTPALTGVSTLSLYHYQSCPYCMKTRTHINMLGLNISLRDIKGNNSYKGELIKNGHKAQVPCLRIDLSNGQNHWLYESDDIIDFLNRHANDKRT